MKKNLRTKMNLTWRNPPAHHWSAAKSPGLSLQCKRSRAHQTALAHFRSGHLRSMTFVQEAFLLQGDWKQQQTTYIENEHTLRGFFFDFGVTPRSNTKAMDDSPNFHTTFDSCLSYALYMAGLQLYRLRLTTRQKQRRLRVRDHDHSANAAGDLN
ncbi:uncharacterized protein TNCV_2183541 [Trichonephila clavipes]|nr:uncharacterized protein TNCV_2183541 [Trichonephila clavipes]